MSKDDSNAKSYDSDDAIFLTAVIKCEEEYIDNDVTVNVEEVYDDNGEGEDIWGCKDNDTFLQVYDGVDNEDVQQNDQEDAERNDKIVGDEENWGCDDTFRQICNNVDNDVTVKIEDAGQNERTEAEGEGEGIWGCDDTFRQICDEVDEEVHNGGTEAEGEGTWGCDDTLVQICDEMEDMKAKSYCKYYSNSNCGSDLLRAGKVLETDTVKGNSLNDNSPMVFPSRVVPGSLVIQQDEIGSQHYNSSQESTSSPSIVSVSQHENIIMHNQTEETTDEDERNARQNVINSSQESTSSSSIVSVSQQKNVMHNQPEETTDVDERNTKQNVMPEPPRKENQERQGKINYEKLIHHKIQTLRDEPGDGHSCPSDCSDCNTDTEVRMGFNLRDVVLMTSSAEESAKEESSTKNMPSGKIKSTDSHREEEVPLSNSSYIESTNKKSVKHARKRKIFSHSKRKRLNESSESDSSSGNKSRAKTKFKRRVPNKRKKMENQKRKQNSSNDRRRMCSSSSDFIKDTSSESESSSSNDGDNNKSVGNSRLSNSTVTSYSLAKIVDESSPKKLKVVLEDINPNGLGKAFKTKGSSRKITRSIKAGGLSEFDSDAKDQDNTISPNEISDNEKNYTYTRSRPVKPGPKYRYRRQHTGATDEENESSSVSSKGEIEFEDESENSSTSAGTCSAVPSEDISDPEEDDGIEEANEKCIVCRALGDTDVRGRSRITNTYWCQCDRCAISSRVMRDYDRVCCRELTNVVEFMNDELETSSQENLCITKHPRFQKDVLGFGAYLRTQKNAYFCSKTAAEDKRVYYAMLSFIRWIFDRMIDGDRIMPPACVIKAIREAHMQNPSDPRFRTFQPVKYCETGFHCKAAMGIRTGTGTGDDGLVQAHGNFLY